MLRAYGAPIWEIASRCRDYLKTRTSCHARAKANGVATESAMPGSAGRDGLRETSVTRMGGDAARGCVAIGDSMGRPVHGRAPLLSDFR